MAAQSLDGVVAHWSTLIENFQTSPLDFYRNVEEALARRQVPETKNSRVDHREAGLLSARREYLHVTRETFNFDICGAPFGTGFFVSWWLTDDLGQLNVLQRFLAVAGLLLLAYWVLSLFGFINGLVAIAAILFIGLSAVAIHEDFDDRTVRALPLIGPLYIRLFKPPTFYRIDTMEMFQKAVHNAVLEVIDTMTAAKGIRALADSDRKPIMREFYARR